MFLSPGTYYVKVVSRDYYPITIPYRLMVTLPNDIYNATIETIPAQGHTGSAIKPAPKVMLEGKVLKRGTDYTLSYKNNVKVGTATVTVTGKGAYTGARSKNFNIVQGRKIANAKVAKVANQAYTGSTVKPKPKVVYGGTTLTLGTDYTLTYKNNVKVGTATIVVKGKGLYVGSKKVTFKIVKKPKIANTIKVSTASKTVTVGTLKKKAVAIAPIVVKKAQGTVTYKKLSGSGALAVNKKTGKVSIKKGTKVGTYTAKVRVSAAGNVRYKAANKTVTIKVKVIKKVVELEPNNTYDQADKIKLGTTIYGKTDWPDDDRFAITIPSSGYYRVTVANDKAASGGYLYVRIKDADQYSVDSFDVSTGSKTSTTRNVWFNKGKNYVWIWGSSSFNQHPYHLRIAK